MRPMHKRHHSQFGPDFLDLEQFDAFRVEDLSFVRDFVRMCDEGWRQGWHERNGGNASYRLTEADVEAAQACLDAAGAGAEIGFAPCAEAAAEPLVTDEWVALSVCEPDLAGEWMLITATGSYMQNVRRLPDECLGIIEISPEGDAYRVMWGFANGGRPTSELSAHVLIHAHKKAATQGCFRVLYHCHPTPVIALTHALPHDARTVSRLLWKMMTECVMVFPQGIGMVGCNVPGSMELARATAEQVRAHDAVIWAQHGLLATGETCDAAFGLIHVIVKAVEIYQSACVLAGGAQNMQSIPDDELPILAAGLGVALNMSYLDLPSA